MAAIRRAAAHPELELVGCWVHSAADGKTSAKSSVYHHWVMIATNSIDDVWRWTPAR